MKPLTPKRRIWTAAVLVLIGLSWWFARLAPQPLFDDPLSTVIEDRGGVLLGASIAADGQWRFPPNPQVPDKFRTALIHFEDRRFEAHPGIDPVAIVRAAKENLVAGRVVSGGSTLTMQVARMSRKGKLRTLPQKMIEAAIALRLELSMSKDQILASWCSNAPFGGNVVGLDAAAWRYFGRSPQRLSWAESALLAVLPNAPALIHPGKNRVALLAKRNGLLETLHNHGVIDKTTLVLAVAESLPNAPLRLPQTAPHLLARIRKEQGGVRQRTTVDGRLQKRAVRTMNRYGQALLENNVRNGAALIIDNPTGEVLAYVGNLDGVGEGRDGSAVDIITASRSTGSLLKPFLYAAALDQGVILPKSLQWDVPSSYSGYAPQNFDRTYSGAVPADKALARSLNVPAVRLLRQYGVPRFHHLLTRKLGLTTMPAHADHYGLSLILGGAEGSLWEMAGLYSGMARTLDRYTAEGRYAEGDFAPPHFVPGSPVSADGRGRKTVFSAGAVWQTTAALVQVDRPEARGLWRFFDSARRVAWKTGTSYGFRDAWAIGYTPQHTVAVWFGNADGEGRPGLTGVSTAAPVMFELFELLESKRDWFQKPGDLRTIEICAQSGYRAGTYCEDRQEMGVTEAGLRTKPCSFHKLVHLDEAGLRVTDACMSPAAMVHEPWFVLPTGPAWFYRELNPDYRPLPPFREGCGVQEATMALISPRDKGGLFIPVELDGNRGKVVFEVAHRNRDKIVHWHLNDTYLGRTKRFHQMALSPPPGRHQLTLVDEDGAAMKRRFRVLGEAD